MVRSLLSSRPMDTCSCPGRRDERAETVGAYFRGSARLGPDSGDRASADFRTQPAPVKYKSGLVHLDFDKPKALAYAAGLRKCPERSFLLRAALRLPSVRQHLTERDPAPGGSSGSCR